MRPSVHPTIIAPRSLTSRPFGCRLPLKRIPWPSFRVKCNRWPSLPCATPAFTRPSAFLSGPCAVRGCVGQCGSRLQGASGSGWEYKVRPKGEGRYIYVDHMYPPTTAVPRTTARAQCGRPRAPTRSRRCCPSPPTLSTPRHPCWSACTHG